MVEIRDLRMGYPAPNFRLTSATGDEVELRNYRHRQPVVLFFSHSSECADCQTCLREFQQYYADYQFEDVAIIALVPASPSDAAHLQQRLGLRFVILCDPDRAVYRKYGLDLGHIGLFVLDRYNGQQIGECKDDTRGLMPPDVALEWAIFSETTCPECGVLEWPESSQ